MSEQNSRRMREVAGPLVLRHIPMINKNRAQSGMVSELLLNLPSASMH